MQRMWQFLARRKDAESAPEEEDRPLCAGLAAAPVHEIRGPILAYPLAESPVEDEVVYERGPPPPAGALQEVAYEQMSRRSDLSDPRAPPPPPPCPPPPTPPTPATVRRTPAGRASAVTLWLRWHLSAVARAFLCGWQAFTWPLRASGARACDEVMRFVAWEQWKLEGLVASRYIRLPWISRLSLMWAMGMIFVSGGLLAAWYSDEFGNKSTIPLAWRMKMILPLLPVFLLVHLADGISALVMYRAYVEMPSIRRRTAREERRRQQCMEGLRRREEQTRNSDGSSSSTTRSMVNIPLPESTLNMSEAGMERESGDLQSRALRQHQQQPRPGPSSQPRSEQIPQPHLQIVADGDSGREADIESSESSLLQSPQPPVNSKGILRHWLLTAALSYVAYTIGMVVTFVTGDTYVALLLLFAIVAGILPTLDVFADYFEIDERQGFVETSDAELTHSSTFGREMVDLAQGNGLSRAPRHVDERTPLLARN